jgi:GAF domain-containing protein
LTMLATRIASAIENARLFERTRRQADTLLLLNEVARETSSVLDVEGVLRRAAEMVKRVIDYQILWARRRPCGGQWWCRMCHSTRGTFR